ncbi:MAG: thiamine-phosphate kinase [Candidatus Micrarchaeota archaeon]
MVFSERKIIASICKGIQNHASIMAGAGSDDAACVRIGNKTLVFTSDIMFGSSHFPKKLSLDAAGRKAVVANISDLASMGSEPLYIMISLGIPKSQKGLGSFIQGIKKACREYSAVIIGGDTKCSRELTVTICAIGRTDGNILARSNAKPGDVVAVTGNIGSAFCGLHSLLNNKKINRSLSFAFINPKARVTEGRLLSHLSPRVAAMDITDGLLYTASEIARESKVGIKLDSSQIPISKLAVEYANRNRIPFARLINTGEDYELCVSLSERDFERLKNKLNLTKIGRVVKGKGIWLDGKRIDAKGYDAFNH